MKTIITLLLLCSVAIAGPVFEFNPASAWVTNRGVRLFWPWEFTGGAFPSNIIGNALSYPVGVPLEFTKASNGTVQALTAVESNLVITLTASNQNFLATNEAARFAAFERTNAPAVFGLATDERNRILKAVVFITLGEINILRANQSLPPRTTNQLLNAISNALNDATQ